MDLAVFLDASMDFLFGPRTLIAHLGVMALLWRAHTRGFIHRRVLLLMSLALLALTFILWLFVTNTWVSIVTSYVCVVIYERLCGPRLRIKKNAVFQAGEIHVANVLIALQ